MIENIEQTEEELIPSTHHEQNHLDDTKQPSSNLYVCVCFSTYAGSLVNSLTLCDHFYEVKVLDPTTLGCQGEELSTGSH